MIPTLLHAGVVVPVNRSISTDSHLWTLESIERTEKVTVCHWVVETLSERTFIQMTPGVYLKDNKGKKYEVIYCNLPMSPDRKIIYGTNVRYEFLVIFPVMDKDVKKVSYYSNENFHIDDIALSINEASSSHPLLSPFFEKSKINYSTTDGNKSCKIVNVEILKDKTVISFDYENRYDAGGWCSINKNTYIITDQSGKKLTLLRAEGIPISPSHHEFSRKGDHLKFKLIFPAITDGSKSFDLIEPADSEWKFYGIINNNI